MTQIYQNGLARSQDGCPEGVLIRHKNFEGLFEDVLLWVDREAIQANLVVQVRGSGPAAIPYQGNLVSALDTSTPFDQAFL